MGNLLIVAGGGALGALARYALVTAMAPTMAAFPIGTLSVNVLGSMLMGVLIEAIALGVDVPEQVRLGLAIGVLGAFTTFSSFSLDSYVLYQDGRFAALALYITGSVFLSLCGLFVGIWLTRAVATL